MASFLSSHTPSHVVGLSAGGFHRLENLVVEIILWLAVTIAIKDQGVTTCSVVPHKFTNDFGV